MKNTAMWKAAKNYCDDRRMEFLILTEHELGISFEKLETAQGGREKTPSWCWRNATRYFYAFYYIRNKYVRDHSARDLIQTIAMVSGTHPDGVPYVLFEYGTRQPKKNYNTMIGCHCVWCSM